jgi:hypothetical protein
MRPRKARNLPISRDSESQPTISTKSNRISTLDGTASFSDDSLVGIASLDVLKSAFKGNLYREMMERASPSHGEELDHSSPQSSTATLTEESEDLMEAHPPHEFTEEGHSHNLLLRGAKGTQGLYGNDPRLYENIHYEDYDNEGDDKGITSDELLFANDENFSTDEESNFSSGGGWRNTADQNLTFDNHGRILPLPGQPQDVQDVSRRRFLQIFHAASEAAGGITSKQFPAIKKWYERYTRVRVPNCI